MVDILVLLCFEIKFNYIGRVVFIRLIKVFFTRILWDDYTVLNILLKA